jgi:hypothetical protein
VTAFVRPRSPAAMTALAFTTVAAAVFAVARPPVGDFWAAQARQSAAVHGVGLRYWFAWFGGTVPGHYSVLAPFLSRFVDVGVLGATATAATVALCRLLVRGTPHATAATWMAAVAATSSLWSGRIPFAAGTALMLLTLLLMRAGRPILAAAAGAVTALVSPVSAAFLVLGLAGVVLHDRDRRRLALWTAGGASVCLLSLGAYFGLPGNEGWKASHAGLTALSLAILLAARPPAQLRTVVILSLVACPLLALVPNGVGSNFERFAWIYLPVAVVAFGQARRAVVVLAASGGVLMGVLGSGHDLYVAAQPMSQQTYYSGLIHELDAIPNLRNYRVEVVPDGTHVAAFALLNHAQLARGYETQSDNKLDSVLMSTTLDAASMRGWLDKNAVAYVVLDRQTLAAGPEDRLVRSGRLPYLHRVWSDQHLELLAVRAPTPLVERPARVAAADQASLTVWAPRAGRFGVRIRWSNFLRVAHAAPGVQLSPDGTGWTVLTVPAAGRYAVTG